MRPIDLQSGGARLRAAGCRAGGLAVVRGSPGLGPIDLLRLLASGLRCVLGLIL